MFRQIWFRERIFAGLIAVLIFPLRYLKVPAAKKLPGDLSPAWIRLPHSSYPMNRHHKKDICILNVNAPAN